jgi:enoyl-CoA hydratase
MSDSNTVPVCEYFTLQLHEDASILDVVINRPPVNALVQKCYEEISEICNYVKGHPTVAVLLLRSEGKHFSAGADTNALSGVSAADAARRREKLGTAIIDLFHCAVPVVVAVNGAAVGAGAVLAAAGDIVLMSDDGFLSLPEVDIHLVGGAREIARILPYRQVRAMALTGDRMSAERLYRIGVVHEVVANANLRECAFSYGRQLAGKGFHTMRKWKQALSAIEGTNLNEGLLIEQSISQSLAALNSNSDAILINNS